MLPPCDQLRTEVTTWIVDLVNDLRVRQCHLEQRSSSGPTQPGDFGVDEHRLEDHFTGNYVSLRSHLRVDRRAVERHAWNQQVKALTSPRSTGGLGSTNDVVSDLCGELGAGAAIPLATAWF